MVKQEIGAFIFMVLKETKVNFQLIVGIMANKNLTQKNFWS